MKPSWLTFSIGLASGIGAFLIVAVALGTPEFTHRGFCDKGENVLICTREWANVFAIISGAIVVLVTVSGQRAEAARHAETIRQAKTPDARRVARGRIATDAIWPLHHQMESFIFHAKRANLEFVDTPRLQPWLGMRNIATRTLSIQNNPFYDAMTDLFSYEMQQSMDDLFTACRRFSVLQPHADGTFTQEYTYVSAGDDLDDNEAPSGPTEAEIRDELISRAENLSRCLEGAGAAADQLLLDYDVRA